jgi:uncharacterized protein YdaU (DUF1376 family)
MAALPYIQLYIADYLADTMHLQAEEHGAYLLLIFNYWQTGKPIPKNRLQYIARVGNDRWTDVERSLNEYFNDTGTHWQHDRIDDDLAKIEAKQSQQVLAGKASAAARRAKNRQKTNERSTDVTTDVTTDVSHPLERNGNHTDTDTDTDTDKNKKNRRFKPPELVEVREYITEKAFRHVTAEEFVNFYNSNGWRVGKNKMVSWKHAASGWEARKRGESANQGGSTIPFNPMGVYQP